MYFLKKPRVPLGRDKQYFLSAFGKGPHFFDSQKYVDEREVESAFKRAGVASVEELLALDPSAVPVHLPAFPTDTAPPPRREGATAPSLEVPQWLEPVIDAARLLWNDANTLERDHENVVATLFEALGYHVKFQRAHIDILVEQDGRPFIVVEVKQNRALSRHSIQAIEQGYRYAQAQGAPIVVVTNANCFLNFDRRRGLSYEENRIGQFQLLDHSQEGMSLLQELRTCEAA